MSTFVRQRRRAGRVLVVIALATAAACGAERSVTGVSGGPNGNGTTGRDAALVGEWWRVVIFVADDGSVHSSETTWEFDVPGDARRIVIATNLTYGFFDSVVTRARWHTEGTTAVITYLSPDTGTVRFAYRVTGDTLRLDDREFLRLR